MQHNAGGREHISASWTKRQLSKLKRNPHKLGLTFNDAELGVLTQIAENQGLTPANYLRKAVMALYASGLDVPLGDFIGFIKNTTNLKATTQ